MYLLSKRFFRSSAPLHQDPKQPAQTVAEQAPLRPTAAASSDPASSARSNPTKFVKMTPGSLDKQYLVWSGHYKSKADIPAQVDKLTIERSRNWARIRINLGFMVVGVIAAAVAVALGKKARREGDTLERRNLEFHRKVKEDYEIELAREAAKKS